MNRSQFLEGHTQNFKGCAITVSRYDSSQEWYITVTDPAGGYLYDGWWRDSEDKTLVEAIAEAKRGAMLE